MANSKELYSDFIRYYGQFRKFLDDEKIHFVGDKYRLTLFGISGAGKSTFLSRLKSNMAPQEFYDNVIERKDERIVVEGVTIGRSITSVTVVPQLHQVGEVAMYDVPGFKDTDNNKKIIINILHKCLLSHVKKNKFIAVLKLDLLEEERMTQLIGDYYDSFERLFGKNYRKCIDNVYFVITHFDKRNLRMEDIPNIVKEKLFSAIDLDKDQLAYFLKRLVKKHIVVNYKEDSQEDLLQRISDLLKAEEAEGITEVNIPHLDVYENELNQMLKKDLEDFSKSNNDEAKKTWDKLKVQRESYQVALKEKKDFIEKKEQVERELGLVNDFLKTVDNNIDLLTKKIDSLTYEQKTLETDTASQEVIMGVLEKTLMQETMVHVRADVSQKATLGGHFYENIINFEPNLYKERIILITRAEDDDKTLRAHLANKRNSIIPYDIQQISNFHNDIVLYNNHAIKPNITVNSTYSENAKHLRISVKYPDPFKVYLYYTQELNSSQIYDKTKQHFISTMESNTKRHEGLEKEKDKLRGEIDAIVKDDSDKRKRRQELMTQQTELTIKINERDQTLTRIQTEITELLAKQTKFVSDTKSQTMYTTGKTIGEIFQKNSLSSSINDQIKNINKFVDDSLLQINSFKDSTFANQTKAKGAK